ncbi:diguanylate cyclase (GGDEF)-like protein [Catenulispora sp. MAP5-51]|uniref:GGDEF domain-containing protein n=1 Tax=Catenulispora sp. MAP5-51 TaxID=3156298 RepID=UPI0035194989
MIDSALMLTGAGTGALGTLNLFQHRRLHTARHDPLTGLPARQLWTSRAERAIRRPRGLVFLIVDGDGLKQINDRYGHEAGDALLVAFAQRLRAWAGDRGLAGRLGGDEFAAFLRVADGAPVAGQLERLSTELSAAVQYRDRTLRAGASIGAVIVNRLSTQTFSEAMRAADKELYHAKQAGRGRWRLPEGDTSASPEDPVAREAGRVGSASDVAMPVATE